MSVEEFIKTEADKRITEFKMRAKEKGLELNETNEMYIRLGIGYGISIAGLGLAYMDTNALLINKGE